MAGAKLRRHARPGLLLWVPAGVGAVFFVVFLAKFPAFVGHVYWDSDAASAATLTQAVGHGTITFQRFAYYLFFGPAALTRWLPLHRQLWEGAPYFLALVSVGLLSLVSWRIAGRWAAAMTATVGVATSPLVSYDRVTLNYHTPTFFATAVLAVFCFWLARERPPRTAALASLAAGVFAGIALEDQLFVFVGVLPLACAALALAAWGRSHRLRVQGGLGLGAAAIAIPVAWLVEHLAAADHIYVYPSVPSQFVAANELSESLRRLVNGIAQLANGNYFAGAPVDVTSSLSLGCAVAMLLALAAPFALVRRERRSRTPRIEVVVVATFWSACVLLDCASFALSNQSVTGVGVYFYFTPVLYAVAATAPLVVSSGVIGRSLVAAGVTVVALTSTVNLFGSQEFIRPLPEVASVASRIVALARQEHAPYGYASYWDASDLMWKTSGAVRMAPVELLEGAVEPFAGGNVSSSWFVPHRSRSFLLGDTSEEWLIAAPPPYLGPPAATIAVTPQITMWVYPYDISTRFVYPPTPWSPLPNVTVGSGFYPTEQYQGASVNWMTQDGRLRIADAGLTAVTIDATVFSNGRSRTLEVRDGDTVLARLSVPTNAVAFQTRPLLLPPGVTTLTLIATPGPATLGPTDPRSASILFSGLHVEKDCATLVPASGQLSGCPG